MQTIFKGTLHGYLLFCLFFLISSQSLRKKYGPVYSMKVGSFKLVIAEDADSVKEVLVKKSADYAGRPPFYSLMMSTLGMSCELLTIALSLRKWEKYSTNVPKKNIQILNNDLRL